MAPDRLRGVREFVSTSKRWIPVALVLVLSALILPFPESPFVLGAVLAIVVWGLQRYRS